MMKTIVLDGMNSVLTLSDYHAEILGPENATCKKTPMCVLLKHIDGLRARKRDAPPPTGAFHVGLENPFYTHECFLGLYKILTDISKSNSGQIVEIILFDILIIVWIRHDISIVCFCKLIVSHS